MSLSGSLDENSAKADTINKTPISSIRKWSMVMIFKIGLRLSILSFALWLASHLSGLGRVASLSADAVLLGALLIMVSILGEPRHGKAQ